MMFFARKCCIEDQEIILNEWKLFTFPTISSGRVKVT